MNDAVPDNTLICHDHHQRASDGNGNKLYGLEPGFHAFRRQNHSRILSQAGKHTSRMINHILHLVDPSGEMTDNALGTVIGNHAVLQQGVHIKPVGFC